MANPIRDVKPSSSSEEKVQRQEHEREFDPLEVERRAARLLAEERKGDEHFPGEVNAERVRLGKDLPRRT